MVLLIGMGADLPVTVKDATALRDVLVDPNRATYPLAQVLLLVEASKSEVTVDEKGSRDRGGDSSEILMETDG